MTLRYCKSRRRRSKERKAAWKPKKLDLAIAYKMFKANATWKEIAAKLGKSVSEIQKNRFSFVNHFEKEGLKEEMRKYKKEERRPGGVKGMRKFTLNMRKQYLDLMAYDITQREACKIIGIGYTTVYEWGKKYPYFKRQEEMARAKDALEVKKSLKNSALGGVEVKSSVKRIYNHKGKLLGKEIKKERIPVKASVRAQEFYLINRAGYKRDNESRTTDNKGAILKEVEKMTNITDEEMEEFE